MFVLAGNGLLEMNTTAVPVATAGIAEPLAADTARVRLLAGVDALVPLHTSSVITAVLAAQLTLEPASEFSFVVLVSLLK